MGYSGGCKILYGTIKSVYLWYQRPQVLNYRTAMLATIVELRRIREYQGAAFSFSDVRNSMHRLRKEVKFAMYSSGCTLRWEA